MEKGHHVTKTELRTLTPQLTAVNESIENFTASYNHLL